MKAQGVGIVGDDDDDEEDLVCLLGRNLQQPETKRNERTPTDIASPTTPQQHQLVCSAARHQPVKRNSEVPGKSSAGAVYDTGPLLFLLRQGLQSLSSDSVSDLPNGGPNEQLSGSDVEPSCSSPRHPCTCRRKAGVQGRHSAGCLRSSLRDHHSPAEQTQYVDADSEAEEEESSSPARKIHRIEQMGAAPGETERAAAGAPPSLSLRDPSPFKAYILSPAIDKTSRRVRNSSFWDVMKYVDVPLSHFGLTKLMDTKDENASKFRWFIGKQCCYLKLGTSLVFTGIIAAVDGGLLQFVPDKDQPAELQWIPIESAYCVPEDLATVRKQVRKTIVETLREGAE
jgi:hypothetical protein